MPSNFSKLDEIPLWMQIENSGLQMTEKDDDGRMYVSPEDVQPLRSDMPVATLTLTGEDMDAEADLNSDDLDALVEALQRIQELINDD